MAHEGSGGPLPRRRAAAAASTAPPPPHPPPPGEPAARLPPPAPESAAAALARAAVESPFVDLDHPVGVYEALKLAAMAPVAAAKVALLVAALAFSAAALRLLLARCAPRGAPYGPRRAALVAAWVSFWARFVLFVAGFYRVPLRGAANLRAARAARAVLVFNHESYVDAVAVVALFCPAGLVKAGVSAMPFISTYAEALQCVLVERRGAADAGAAGPAAVRGGAARAALAARAADPARALVALAPEATTKARRCLLAFRTGAFDAGRPVCPVLLRYRYARFNPGWGLGPTPVHLWRLLSQLVNRLEVEVLPPVGRLEGERAPAYAERVRRLMAAALGVPLAPQGLAEHAALAAAGVTTDWRGTRVVVRPPRAAARGGGGAGGGGRAL